MHKCIEEVNKALEERNAALCSRTKINFKTGKISTIGPILQVEKLDPKIRKPLPTLLCNFCPFCGKSLAEKPEKRKAVKRAKV